MPLRGYLEALGRPFNPALRRLDPARQRPGEEANQTPATHGLDDVGVEAPFVEPGSPAQVRDCVQRVVVVRDEKDQRASPLHPAFDLHREIERLTALAEGGRDHPKGGHEPVLRVATGIVDEACIEPERNVVQEDPSVDRSDVNSALLAAAKSVEHGHRIIAVEAEISGKVVPGSERDADKGHVVLESLAGHGPQRPISPGHPERGSARLCTLPGDRGDIVPAPERVGVDPPSLGLCDQLLGRRLIVSRPRIDDQEGTAWSSD
jgi:hypothetical protein